MPENSAGGSAVEGRDKKTQAVLYLRGKILNTYSSSLEKVASQEDLFNIISALGTRPGKDFDMDKLRFHKIIVTTDSDEDGNHIDCLVGTFFYKFYPEVIKAGYLYFAQPPINIIKQGSKVLGYLYNKKEKEDWIVSQYNSIEGTKYKSLKEIKSLDNYDKFLSKYKFNHLKGLGGFRPV